jgi:hypothetical protein
VTPTFAVPCLSFDAFSDVKVSELANLGLRQNLCHDFRLFRARVDHNNSVEAVAGKVTGDFFSVAMLSVGKPSVHPVQVVMWICTGLRCVQQREQNE